MHISLLKCIPRRSLINTRTNIRVNDDANHRSDAGVKKRMSVSAWGIGLKHEIRSFKRSDEVVCVTRCFVVEPYLRAVAIISKDL